MPLHVVHFLMGRPRIPDFLDPLVGGFLTEQEEITLKENYAYLVSLLHTCVITTCIHTLQCETYNNSVTFNGSIIIKTFFRNCISFDISKLLEKKNV